MPKRNNQVSHANFCFAAPRTVKTGADSGKPRTRAARSHAAYWGGPAKETRKSSAKVGAKDDQHESSENISKDIQSYLARRLSIPCERTWSFSTLTTCALSRSEVTAANDGVAVDIAMTDLFGKAFLEQIDTSLGREGPILTTAYLLVAIAYSMALTGKGDRILFFHLKEHLLKRVLHGIQEKSDQASLQTMGMILLLGSPIVSLLSYSLPGGLQIEDYVTASMDGDNLCCANSAVTAKESLRETEIHWRTLTRLLAQEERPRQWAGQVAWQTYLSRYLEMAILFEGGNRCYTIPTNTKDIHQGNHIGNSDNNSSMYFWKSPLTIKWHDKHAGTCLEAPMVALGRLMHGWVATFLDETNEEIDPTEDLLRRRLDLRRDIERFISVVVPVKNIETAMLACCHWAASIMLKADQFGIPIYKAARLTPMRPRFVNCLRSTDLSNLWGARRGMLFWVVAVCHRATTGQCFPLLTTALQARFAHLMALSDQHYDIGIIPLRRLYLLEHLCSTTASRPEVALQAETR